MNGWDDEDVDCFMYRLLNICLGILAALFLIMLIGVIW